MKTTHIVVLHAFAADGQGQWKGAPEAVSIGFEEDEGWDVYANEYGWVFAVKESNEGPIVRQERRFPPGRLIEWRIVTHDPEAPHKKRLEVVTEIPS